MKKELFIIFLSLALILAACSQTEIKPAQQTTPTEPAAQQEAQQPQAQAQPAAAEPKQEPVKPAYDPNSLTARAAAANDAAKGLLEKDKGAKTAIDTNIKSAKIGDTVVFGIGIQNILPRTAKFTLETTFIQANFKFGTNFDYTKEYVSKWIDNHYNPYYEVKANEIITVPSYIVVKDLVKEDVNTQPATYVFETAIYTYDDKNFKELYEKKLMSVKIE